MCNGRGALLFQAASLRQGVKPQSWLLTGTTDRAVHFLVETELSCQGFKKSPLVSLCPPSPQNHEAELNI